MAPVYVYVAGPLTTSGLVWHNIRNALGMADILFENGFVPFVPHLTAHWAQSTGPGCARSEEDWMRFCFAWIRRCDCLLRIQGASRGSDREVQLAETLGIPVFYSVEALFEHYKENTALMGRG